MRPSNSHPRASFKARSTTAARLATALLLWAPLLLAGCASTQLPPDAPELVEQVNLERYSGLWYQVGRYPHWFQGGECRLSTARYTLRDDGRINVRNDCWADQVDGRSTQSVTAVARPMDESNAWPRVRFYNLFPANYLIIELSPDYEWAAVSTPDAESLWILSREPALPESTYAMILDRLAARGYTREDMMRTSLQ
jgi:apolipoprotein D and lipocalin family protein